MSRPAATSSGTLRFADGALDPGRWAEFENVACLASTPSSNDLARELIDYYFREEQFLPATLLVAEEQPQARGRGGKDWKAPKGRGIYFTFIRRAAGHEPVSVLPIAVARWIRDAIEDFSGIAARLKWPNDIYVEKRKLAGVLSEARTQGDDTYVAVGVGINVRGTGSELRIPQATTVEQETGRPVALARLLQAIVDRVDRGLSEGDWAREIEEWERVSAHHPGDRIRVRSNSTETTGEYRGLDPSGFLRLATPSGETVVTTGEVEEW